MKWWRVWVACLIKCLIGGLFFQCDTKVAGTSTDIGNPPSIEVVMLDSNQQVDTVSGRFSAYHPDQNPVENPAPVFSLHFDKAQSFSIVSDSFKSLVDTARINLNLTIYKHRPVLIKGFGWTGSTYTSSQTGTGQYLSGDTLYVKTTPMGSISAGDIASDSTQYVYIPGTPHVAQTIAGLKDHNLPLGEHEVVTVRLDSTTGDYDAAARDTIVISE